MVAIARSAGDQRRALTSCGDILVQVARAEARVAARAAAAAERNALNAAKAAAQLDTYGASSAATAGWAEVRHTAEATAAATEMASTAAEALKAATTDATVTGQLAAARAKLANRTADGIAWPFNQTGVAKTNPSSQTATVAAISNLTAGVEAISNQTLGGTAHPSNGTIAADASNRTSQAEAELRQIEEQVRAEATLFSQMTAAPTLPGQTDLDRVNAEVEAETAILYATKVPPSPPSPPSPPPNPPPRKTTKDHHDHSKKLKEKEREKEVREEKEKETAAATSSPKSREAKNELPLASVERRAKRQKGGLSNAGLAGPHEARSDAQPDRRAKRRGGRQLLEQHALGTYVAHAESLEDDFHGVNSWRLKSASHGRRNLSPYVYPNGSVMLVWSDVQVGDTQFSRLAYILLLKFQHSSSFDMGGEVAKKGSKKPRKAKPQAMSTASMMRNTFEGGSCGPDPRRVQLEEALSPFAQRHGLGAETRRVCVEALDEAWKTHSCTAVRTMAASTPFSTDATPVHMNLPKR
eukprot:gene13107-15478_t